MNEGEAMSKKMRRFAATFFVALVLTMLLTQAKYIEPATLYMNNRDLFEDSVRQLHSILDNIVEIGDDVPKEEASSLKVECTLYGEDCHVTVYQYQKSSELGYNADLTPAWGYNYVEQPIELALEMEPDLSGVLTELQKLGISRIEVHDFTVEKFYDNPSPCEIWYVFGAGKRLIYSENGYITMDYDLMQMGYGLHSQRIAPSWFAGDSYYDRNSGYWKG